MTPGAKPAIPIALAIAYDVEIIYAIVLVPEHASPVGQRPRAPFPGTRGSIAALRGKVDAA